MSDCYFCDETERLEQHHIVPRRFGGSDASENMVEVCPTCHSKLEHLYNSRFYKNIGVKQQGNTDKQALELVKDALGKYEDLQDRHPNKPFFPSVKVYEWVNESFDSNLVICPACGYVVEPSDGRCAKCRSVIDE